LSYLRARELAEPRIFQRIKEEIQRRLKVPSVDRLLLQDDERAGIIGDCDSITTLVSGE